MNTAEILRKAEMDEGMTVEEIMAYESLVPKQRHTYGKYGNLARIYLEEHNQGKLWSLAGELPDYLHGIDRQAEELYQTLYAQLSEKEEYKRTGEFLVDLQRQTALQKRIEEAILNQIVYESV